ncbi:hypothetical protein A2982_04160 [candidate division WWE3 bacterium RIFCSPLOWO2_01_FULL_39_13]|uniref:Uncharacterized protein n=1 Tax=candidate division WWE3 bacterium RIFCSPLOWO2_01_FULL_39_13 TaxID=1802624 RepID=A0A1F4V283_UNCKA|nr:MAG: hypothetical protein A2982_04160 [candidate division WWE3 bacterium RIFCSPLOWO2_01_FULL_39_13]
MELLQWEITNIAMQASGELTAFIKNEGVLLFYQSYPSRVYAAGLTNGYILSLSPDIISRITSFYDVRVEGSNVLLDNIEKIRSENTKALELCLLNSTAESDEITTCEKETQLKRISDKMYSERRIELVSEIGSEAFKILEVFQPTENRLKSPFLRLFMGNEAVEVMKGWK